MSNHFLLFHNDAHNYKITGILKQLKFRPSLLHVSGHAWTIIREPFLCLAKTTVMVLYPRPSWRGQCHGSIPTCCAGVRYTAHPHNRLVHHCETIKKCFDTVDARYKYEDCFLICYIIYWWEQGSNKRLEHMNSFPFVSRYNFLKCLMDLCL
jgi:hypothetical protein